MTPPDDRTPGRSSTRRLIGRGATVALVLGALAIFAVVWLGFGSRDRLPSITNLGDDASQTEFDYDYVIPDGTADRIASGETVDIVPAELTVSVGQSIRIVNQDSENHVVGVFYVPAGKTLTQHFNSPGELIGTCDIHESGTFKLVVEP